MRRAAVTPRLPPDGAEVMPAELAVTERPARAISVCEEELRAVRSREDARPHR